MKIVLFENERSMVEGAFETMNLVFFQNRFQFKYFSTSQEGLPYNLLDSFDAIFVDIQLTAKSELDGFNLIKELLKQIKKDKIVILTGYSKNEEILKELGLPDIPVVIKPIDYVSLHEFFKKHFPSLL